MNPRISIVIDNFNNGRFIQQAIDSCLNQSFPAHEIIIVDDGSTDHSRELLASYKEIPNIKIILQENQGLEAALQKGFDHCTGDWVLGLDSDDFYMPDCLQMLSAAFHEDLSLIYFRAKIIDAAGQENGSLVPPGKLHCDGSAIESWIINGRHHSFPPQSFNCYPIKLIRDLRIYPHETVCMKKGFSPDRYFQIQAVLKGKVKPIDRILGAYRILESGDTTKKRTNLALLRQSLLRQDLVMSQIQKQLRDLDITPHPLFRFNDNYWFFRMLSLVTDPPGHTYHQDTRLALLKTNLISQWKDHNRHQLIGLLINHLKLFLMLFLPEGFFFRLYLLRPKHRITQLIRTIKKTCGS
jgi:glycosyltransferase involved in cell wall biosynthesis